MRPLRLPLHIGLLVLALGCLPACSRESSTPVLPSQLERALSTAALLEVRLPSVQGSAQPGSSRALQARVELAARTLAARRGGEIRVLAGVAGGDARVPRFVLGTTQDPTVRELVLGAGGEDLGEGRLSWNGCVLQAPGDVVLACFEDPERPGLPLNLIIARDPADLLEVCRDLTPTARPGMRFLRRNTAVLDLPLTNHGRVRGSARGALDWGNWIDVKRVPRLRVRRGAGVSDALAREYVGEIDAALGTLRGWAGGGSKTLHDVLLVGHGETQRALAGGAAQFAGSGSLGRSFALLAEGLATDGGAGVARAEARGLLGEPLSEWMLDAAGLDAAGSWWGVPLCDWGVRLVAQELLPASAQIMHAASLDKLSQHVLAPSRGLLWSYLAQRDGASALQAIWRGEREVQVDDTLFRDWIMAGAEQGTAGVEQRRAERLAGLEVLGFLRGVCFASNVQAGGGFDGPGLTSGLTLATKLTVNTVSVTSFFSEEPRAARIPGDSTVHGRECLEGDVALAQLFASARARGIGALALRPQLLLSESAGHSHWLRRTERAHWQEFYDEYERMLTHYALLAELCGVDLLVLGTDLSGPLPVEGAATELADYRRGELSALISKLRGHFEGALTYAASWPSEARRFEHWEQLDYVGVSWFPHGPVRAREPRKIGPLRADWQNQLGGMAELATKAAKPWLVLEFGVRATEGGTKDAALGAGPADPLQQARAVRALVEAVKRLESDGRSPAGLFWWHWNTASNVDAAASRGYSLQGQPGGSELGQLGHD